jgi:hypothetical protein
MNSCPTCTLIVFSRSATTIRISATAGGLPRQYLIAGDSMIVQSELVVRCPPMIPKSCLSKKQLLVLSRSVSRRRETCQRVVCDCVKCPDMVVLLLKRALKVGHFRRIDQSCIKGWIVPQRLPRTDSHLCIHLTPVIMGSSQPFIPVLKDIPPPSRGLSSSIWAPQPLPTDASWQQAITSFSQSAEEDKGTVKPDNRRGPTFRAPDRDEDVFGPIDFLRADHKKDVGAIGDGRKKTSPDAVNNVNSTRFLVAYKRWLMALTSAHRTASSCAGPQFPCSIRASRLACYYFARFVAHFCDIFIADTYRLACPDFVSQN